MPDNIKPLFEDVEGFEPWRKHWQNMPEFVVQQKDTYHSIKIHFATKEDMLAFSKLVEQTVTNKTYSLWYPKQNKRKPSDFTYIDKNEP